MVGRLYGMRRRNARARAGELLERFDLVDAATAPRDLLGRHAAAAGPRGRARGRPPVLFLDEPTTGLDPRSRLELWETIEELVAEGTTVLLTTQYLDEADRLADRSPSSTTAVIAEGTPTSSRTAVGRRGLEGAPRDPTDRSRAGPPRADVRTRVRTGGEVVMTVRRRAGHVVDGVRRSTRRGPGRRPGLRRPTLDDVFLRSPATWPRRTTHEECA
jgi:ABC-2 type transport system ATP-binding protein